VNELDKEADETHDREANGRRHGDLLELLAVRLGAALDESDGVLGKLTCRLHVLHHLVHPVVMLELLSTLRLLENFSYIENE